VTGRYSEYDNVTDFIEFKLHRLIEQFAMAKRADIATVLSNALDEYLIGQIDIVFVDGWPHIVQTPGNQSDNMP